MKQYGSFTGVAERLQKIRLQLRLDCKGMARHLGITAPTYYKNERNATAPSTNSLKKLAKKNDISLDWLLLGKAPQHYEKERIRVAAMEEELDALKKEKKEWLQAKTAFAEKEKQWETEKIALEQQHQKELSDLETRMKEKIKEIKDEHPGALKKLFTRP